MKFGIGSIFVLSLLFSGCSGGKVFQLREAPPELAWSPVEKGHASVQGIQLYYEVHGKREGVPLVLLNGGGSSIEVTYGKILPILAEHRRVIALDEQAHGRSGDRNAPVRFDSSADDVAALLRHLKVDQADVFGFSNGASVGLQLALRHPKLVRKLIFASSITKKSGAPSQFWDYMKKTTFKEMPQPLKDAFLKVNPDPEKLRNMYEKDANRMRNFTDVSDSQVRSVRIPVLVLSGDRDIAKLEHSVELVRLFPKARLFLLPAGHGDYLGEEITTGAPNRYPEWTAALVEDFLDSSEK